jgi:hypothetical protein
MLEFIKPITEFDLESIAENLSCNNTLKFQKQLAQKVVKKQLSKIPNIKLINTEKTIKQKTNFPYIIYHEKEFYFIRIDSGKIPQRKKIIDEQKELENTLGIIPQKILCFNPLKLSSKRTTRTLRKKSYIELIDLKYNQDLLEELTKKQSVEHHSEFKSDLKYVPQKNNLKGGYWKQKKSTEEKISLHYCIGENLSLKQKRKGCQAEFKEEFLKKCKNCNNYRLLIEEPTTHKTKNKYNQQAILYLESLKTPKKETPVKSTGTELSNLANLL